MRSIILRLLHYKRELILGIIALLLVDAGELVIPQIIRRAIDHLTAESISTHLLIVYGAYIFVVALIIGFFRFFWRFFIIGTSRKCERDIRYSFYEHLLKLSASYFNQVKTGDLMAHAVNDIEAIRMAMGMGVVASVDAIFISFFALIAMFRISPLLTLYILIPLPLVSIIVFFFGRLIHRRFKKVQETFSLLTEKVRESIAGIRVLKAFRQEEGNIKDFAEVSDRYVQKNMYLIKVWGMFEPLIMFIAGATMIIALYFGGREVILGRISLGELVAFITYLGMMTWPMAAIGWVVNLIQRGSVSMHRIEKILAVVPQIVDNSQAIEMEICGDIEFRNLTFSYDSAQSPVLKNISLHIKSGYTVGIVGKTGCGKTTLANLLPRIFDPPRGTIFIDGNDIRDISLKCLRRAIAVVPQDSFLFSTTLKKNIAFGNIDLSTEEIDQIVRLVDICDEIEQFPGGINAEVGERGVTLSSGQRQRIALARALAMNPRILILDDALSAVDSITQRNILTNIYKLFAQKTCIIISHKISAVKDADIIIVLDEGRITEMGNHQDLLLQNGFYWRLYEMQSLEEELERTA